MKEYSESGNCWSAPVAYTCTGDLNDVCNEHDEPRGECSERPPCDRCGELVAEEAMQELR